MNTKRGTFKQFQTYTLAVARGERSVDPRQPKIWLEATDTTATRRVRFASLEAGAKLLSTRNRALLRLIAARQPQSVSELATLSGRAQQNLLRTLRKLCAAGLVRLDKGSGRALRPSVTARKVHFEIDLLA